MKAIILAGGLGTRISEETDSKPKPMVEIGGMPILWHIMRHYYFYGIDEFIICCGYKGYVIKEFFANYFLHKSDVTFDMQNNHMEVHNQYAENWKVTLVDTGAETMTGGRLKRVRQYVEKEECFCFTYGDGLSNVNIANLIQFHREHGKKATMTAVFPPGRFGSININDDGSILTFKEKPKGDGVMVNGGFFVLKPEVFDLIDGDSTVWEASPLESLASQSEIMAYQHHGFWRPMDTLSDKNYLEHLWSSNAAPWLMKNDH